MTRWGFRLEALREFAEKEGQQDMETKWETETGSLYERVRGFDRILTLTRRWHALCLADPLAAHPFEHALHPQHDECLAAYLPGVRLLGRSTGDLPDVSPRHFANRYPGLPNRRAGTQNHAVICAGCME